MPGERLGHSPGLILLDTHVWLWWLLEPEKLSPAQDEAIAGAGEAGGEVCLSAFSCWEVARLVQGRRVELDLPLDRWMTAATDDAGFEVVAVDREIAIEANRLPGEFHRDPADRIIVATARLLGVPLLTRDARILAYPHVEAVG